MLMIILLFILAGAGLLFFAMRSTSGGALSAINVRLGRYGLTSQALATAAAAPTRPQASGLTRTVERVVDRGGIAAPLADRLERADLKMTPAEFISFAFVGLVVLALVGLIVKAFIGLGIGIVIALVIPWIYLNRRINKRKK